MVEQRERKPAFDGDIGDPCKGHRGSLTVRDRDRIGVVSGRTDEVAVALDERRLDDALEKRFAPRLVAFVVRRLEKRAKRTVGGPLHTAGRRLRPAAERRARSFRLTHRSAFRFAPQSAANTRAEHAPAAMTDPSTPI